MTVGAEVVLTTKWVGLMTLVTIGVGVEVVSTVEGAGVMVLVTIEGEEEVAAMAVVSESDRGFTTSLLQWSKGSLLAASVLQLIAEHCVYEHLGLATLAYWVHFK